MKNQFRRPADLLLVILALFLLPSPVPAETGRAALGVGFEFATGDYGTAETTDSYTVPVVISYDPTDRLDLELTFPWIYQSRSTTVTLGGMRVPADGSLAGARTGRMGMLPGRPRSLDVTEAQSGPGDAYLTAGFALVQETATSPLVRPVLYLKFPTGNEEKGLGTGEFDFGGGVGLAKWFGHWSTYVEGMVILPGSSDDFQPDHYWTYQAAVSFLLTERLRPGLALSGSTSPFEAAPDALTAKARLSYWATDRVSIGGYLASGLADGSPDFGAGISAYLGF